MRGGADSAYGLASINGASNGEVTPKQPQQASSTAPNQQSPFEYIPITALDDYGQSTQLRHAMESASRYGTPILACICCSEKGTSDEDEPGCSNEKEEDAIVVCSLQRPRPGVISPSPGRNIASVAESDKSVHPSIQGMVRLLATRDDVHHPSQSSEDMPQHALHTAIVTTGVQSDASFLLRTLQTHMSKYWFRYDTLPSASGEASVVKMVRDILLDCLGYDRGEEANSGAMSGGIGSAAPSYDERDDDDDRGGSRAGRPLGVCSFLLGLDSATRPYLTVVKANGASQQYVAQAMGMGSQLANEKLSQQWRRRMSQPEASEMMKGILTGVAKEKGWMPEDADDTGRASTDLVVVCETVTPRGIAADYFPLS
ncbi:hypothetical protein ACHAXT_005904 [Thalassiosira profunda]